MSDDKPTRTQWAVRLGDKAVARAEFSTQSIGPLADDEVIALDGEPTGLTWPGPIEVQVEGPLRPLRPPSFGLALPREKLAEIAERHGVELLGLPATARFHDGEQWAVWAVWAVWWDGADAFLLRGDGVIVRLENAWVSKVESDPADGVEETDLIVRPVEFSFKPAGQE